MPHRLLVSVLEDMHQRDPIFFNQDVLLVNASRASLAIRVLLSKYRQIKQSHTSKRVLMAKALGW